ncbi:SIS domain-containing protein [Alteromonas sp. KUL49]|uniref:glucosamine-6-phosphate deaminase NagB-II n=1 Tax=Alteromonas sp. KUL49 TaxID=2480798 RepID=UPI00102EED86|nr:SIS domain-containing protein [Alteromonas sp. KUL49]TAP34123.1 SIS domain-containing protein [Alteromonas sp. KUL49]GEA13604.1 glutamine--fructose-6-phosphate aminotransferase [Alteromonas sp. KUL49]
MTTTIMAKEAKQSPDVIREQLSANKPVCEAIASKLKAIKPNLVFLIGRGSSDHAGVYAKYLFEVELGLPVSSAAPSVSGVFNQTLSLKNSVAIVISQSGRSPDILKKTERAKAGGAFTIALVNDETSPLANMVDAVLPLRAGPEKAVAATKSYLATLSALCQLCATWSENNSLLEGLDALPNAMAEVISHPAQLSAEKLKDTRNAVVLGRGFGYAVGREVALKLKEVLSIHAEAFSSAEFIHGPVTLVENELQIINLPVDDESKPFHDEIIKDVERRGAELQTIDIGSPALHKRLLPLLTLQRFYLDIEAIAVELGLNPDTPPGLNKVTETH